MYRKYLKPVFDLVVAVTALILLLPLFVLCYFMLALANSGKVFFFQPRPGKNEKIFTVIKFKTMNDRKDLSGNLLSDDARLTTIGKLVRKTSLDEIPQLLNVIKGDMSLVGPRPLLVEYLPLYNEIQKKRHAVKPGITGWAQVNGRNAINWQQKFEYDTWYVDHLSFGLDLKIIFMTFAKVFKSEGINAAGSATIEKFKGN
jgi:undecaprenyl phosphate N,N'-diacetylbacillosamine 1-phosphate transferase